MPIGKMEKIPGGRVQWTKENRRTNYNLIAAVRLQDKGNGRDHDESHIYRGNGSYLIPSRKYPNVHGKWSLEDANGAEYMLF